MQFRRRNSTVRGPNELILSEMEKGAQRLVDQGMEQAEAVREVAQLLGPVIEETSPLILRSLLKSMPRMLREHRRIQGGFVRRLRVHWGRALDLYYAMTVAAEESGSEFCDEQSEEAAEGEQDLFEALRGLHARACRTAKEVHCLLSAGLGKGALARCRTLHEIAVTALVLGEYARRDDYSGLAEKFLLHHHVINWADAKVYQEHASILEVKSLGEDEFRELERIYDELIARYGIDYKRDYGWASGLEGVSRPTFADLEKWASLSHLRGYYKWASHEVHADSKGVNLNLLIRGDGQRVLQSGYCNAGLADPGQISLISLHQVTVALLSCSGPASPKSLLEIGAMKQLLDLACEALAEGESAVEEAEERYLVNAGTSGRRWLPWSGRTR